jgi:hypothetical protein
VTAAAAKPPKIAILSIVRLNTFDGQEEFGWEPLWGGIALSARQRYSQISFAREVSRRFHVAGGRGEGGRVAKLDPPPPRGSSTATRGASYSQNVFDDVRVPQPGNHVGLNNISILSKGLVGYRCFDGFSEKSNAHTD